MNILVVTGNFYPEKTGIGVTVSDMTEFLVRLGHSVSVVTTMPHYPEWRIHEAYRGKATLKEEYKGASIFRHWLYVPKKATALKRILGELSFCFSGIVRASYLSYDEIVVVSPPLSVATSVSFVARLRGKKVSSYIKDIQPDAAISLGMLHNPIIVTLSKKLEKLLYACSSRVFVLSEGMKSNLLKKGIDAEKLEILPDSFSAQEFEKGTELQKGSFRSRYGLEEKFLAVYSGNLGIKQNPDILLEVARLLETDPSIHIAVVGQGAMRDFIEKTIRDESRENISLHPLVEREGFAEMLHSANVLLAPQRREVVDIVVPSKLLSYLASGTAVIASVHAESEAAKLLRDNDAGYIVPPESAEEIVSAITKLQKNEELRKSIGNNGKTIVKERFSHKVVFDTYYKKFFAENE